jgi:diguanylate cyclase (GGDEF)-like protein
MAPDPESRPLVLVLDDNLEMCRLIASILSDEEFQPLTFTDPQGALAALKETIPSAVVSDISMPKMDGISFRERLLQDERCRPIPFVFLTARSEVDDRIEGLRVGADAYLTKPFRPMELVETVRNVIRRAADFQATAFLDPLTKSYNRIYLQRKLPLLLEKIQQEGIPAACAMIDIDHFKAINDRFGHQTGDIVLFAVAETIRKNIRKEDVLVRYGGEEFLLFLPNQEPGVAFVVVERIRKLIASRLFTDVSGRSTFHITISSGLSSATPATSLAEIIRAADQRLYYAKEHGRDRTVAASV